MLSESMLASAAIAATATLQQKFRQFIIHSSSQVLPELHNTQQFSNTQQQQCTNKVTIHIYLFVQTYTNRVHNTHSHTHPKFNISHKFKYTHYEFTIHIPSFTYYIITDVYK